MKTLQQVEPRTPISTAPFTISQPGSYYLRTNLTVSSGTAIGIAGGGVTLDLNGYRIRFTANPVSGTVIQISSVLRNLAIVNGNIEGGVPNNAGTFLGRGFGRGIDYSGAAPRNLQVSGISVPSCRYDGIWLGYDDSAVVEGCTVRTVVGNGIRAGITNSSVAIECWDNAIYLRQVSACRGESSDGG